MGCKMLVLLDSSQYVDELEQVSQWFEHWENTFSRFRLDSELSHINSGIRIPTQVSPDFAEVFELARAVERQSDGLVTPFLLDELIKAGYDRSFEQLVPSVDSPGLESHPTQFDLAQIEWDPTTRMLYLPPELHLDFGGIVKGWAAHKTANKLKKYAPVLVDAAGDIAVSGKRLNGEYWPVGVADPFHRSNNLDVLKLASCGVATSGKDRRRWQQHGIWRHHIIDPRTSLPVNTDVLTATVIAPSAIQAEWAAKTSLLLGGRAGPDWLDSNPELAGMLVLEDGQRLYSRAFEKYIWS
jgi:thiamine biosynthesis lipoprotein